MGPYATALSANRQREVSLRPSKSLTGYGSSCDAYVKRQKSFTTITTIPVTTTSLRHIEDCDLLLCSVSGHFVRYRSPKYGPARISG